MVLLQKSNWIPNNTAEMTDNESSEINFHKSQLLLNFVQSRLNAEHETNLLLLIQHLAWQMEQQINM